MPNISNQVKWLKRNFSGRSWFFGVGINQYLHFPDLHNVRKDVQDVLALLVEKYDLEMKNVTLLLDDEATETKIISALDELAML